MKRRKKKTPNRRSTAATFNAENSRLLANIFHEIKTPLNGVLATLELIQMQNKDEALIPYLEIINSSGQHLSQVVQDFMDFAKLKSGRLEIVKTKFSLYKWQTELKNIFLPLALKKGLRLEFFLDPRLEKKMIVADSRRLTQIFANLISNAIKFTEQGEVLFQIDLAPARKGSKPTLKFRVKDSGVGIPADKQKSIFQPFVQADTSTTRNFGGTGLGLAITKHFTQIMGGKLGLTSIEGMGTEFLVLIPTQLSAIEIVPILNGSALNQIDTKISIGSRVLLCEDNPINSILARELLVGLGCQVTCAKDGEQALVEIQKNNYDLVFMDWRMPKLDGLQATRKIRNLGYKSLPIVAMTANSHPEDQATCFRAGMNDFVAKPVRLSELTRVLSRWVNSQHATTTSGETSIESFASHFSEDTKRLCKELLNKSLGNFEIQNRVHQLKTNLRFLKELSLANMAAQIEDLIEKQRNEEWPALLNELIHILELMEISNSEEKLIQQKNLKVAL
jgi:CheY-like chemotaxis protein